MLFRHVLKTAGNALGVDPEGRRPIYFSLRATTSPKRGNTEAQEEKRTLDAPARSSLGLVSKILLHSRMKQRSKATVIKQYYRAIAAKEKLAEAGARFNIQKSQYS